MLTKNQPIVLYLCPNKWSCQFPKEKYYVRTRQGWEFWTDHITLAEKYAELLGQTFLMCELPLTDRKIEDKYKYRDL